MCFKSVTPENAGISSKTVLKFLKTLEEYGFCTHHILMARGDKLFTEVYFKPFHADLKHRMYSVSKSFVAIAIGMAQDDGLLSIHDPWVNYFPEFAHKADEKLAEATIRDALTMESSMRYGVDWFRYVTTDRTPLYFEKESDKIPGTIFDYDSSVSYMLCVIVERVTGKPFLEYMKDKALREIGFSEDSYCLLAPGGNSFGDSGVMCTGRDMLLFARFVMNGGTWNGKRYVSRTYMEDAVKKQVSNDNDAMIAFNRYGYGYQIWKAPRDGFAFIGMGDQFAICDPATDFIFVINADNQGNTTSRAILYHELYRTIVDAFTAPMAEDGEALDALLAYCGTRELFALSDDGGHPFMHELDGVTYRMEENPMGIEWLRFTFAGKKGTLHYRNRQGEKALIFGIGYNEFGKFPEEGYSDLVAGIGAEGHTYDCACSADFAEERKLRIKVQIIDKYFGNACFVFSFKDERVSLNMQKTAEYFLREYEGIAVGKRVYT